jgi:hypothetical protein
MQRPGYFTLAPIPVSRARSTERWQCDSSSLVATYREVGVVGERSKGKAKGSSLLLILSSDGIGSVEALLCLLFLQGFE